MFKKTLLVTGIALAVSAVAQAKEDAIVTGDTFVDTYRWEIDGAASRTNIDPGPDDGDVDNYGIGGTFYFNDVDTTKGPRSEAAFLDHASNVSVGYIYTDADDIVEDLDGDEYGISGRYVLGLDSIPLIFEGKWTRQTPDFSDIDKYTLGFGAYLTDATTMVLSYSTSDVDETNDIDPGDVDLWEIRAKHIWVLDNQGGIELEGFYGILDVDCDNCDDPDAYGIDGTWYVTNDLGFGVGLGKEDTFGIDSDIYSASVEWFVTPHIGLSLAYEYKETDAVLNQKDDTEFNTVLLGARFRF